jgi:hypothetical protein
MKVLMTDGTNPKDGVRCLEAYRIVHRDRVVGIHHMTESIAHPSRNVLAIVHLGEHTKLDY